MERPGAAGVPETGFDDPAFLDRLRRREDGAIEAVVRAYLGQIVRAARGAGLDAARAEDVAQSTFLTFIQKADTFEGRSTLRTWLFGILYRKVTEERRARARDDAWEELDARFERRFDSAGTWVTPPRGADFHLETAEIGEAIEECLEPAPTRQRMAFTLREVEALPTEEICKIMDVTATNLGVMLHRVRNRLRECLEAGGHRA